MKTKELIKRLLELDPDGSMEIVVNSDRHDYPISMGGPKVAYVEWVEEDSWCSKDHPHAEKVISVTADH